MQTPLFASRASTLSRVTSLQNASAFGASLVENQPLTQGVVARRYGISGLRVLVCERETEIFVPRADDGECLVFQLGTKTPSSYDAYPLSTNDHLAIGEVSSGYCAFRSSRTSTLAAAPPTS